MVQNGNGHHPPRIAAPRDIRFDRCKVFCFDLQWLSWLLTGPETALKFLKLVPDGAEVLSTIIVQIDTPAGPMPQIRMAVYDKSFPVVLSNSPELIPIQYYALQIPGAEEVPGEQKEEEA